MQHSPWAQLALPHPIQPAVSPRLMPPLAASLAAKTVEDERAVRASTGRPVASFIFGSLLTLSRNEACSGFLADAPEESAWKLEGAGGHWRPPPRAQPSDDEPHHGCFFMRTRQSARLIL